MRDDQLVYVRILERRLLPLRELLPPGSPGTPADIDRPTYKWPAPLPTDPDDLLDELYRLTPPATSRPPGPRSPVPLFPPRTRSARSRRRLALDDGRDVW